jgi:hypothetical protein
MAKKKSIYNKSGHVDKRQRTGLKYMKHMGKKNSCFVSTVCFGESAIETQIFRNWRDHYLLDRYLGKLFVSWYYNNGEKLSKIIGRFKIVRVFVSYLLSNFSNFLSKWYR